jgi:hypothetical protein
MPTATKLSPKKPARRRVMQEVSAPVPKAVKGSPLAGLDHLVGCVNLASAPVLPPTISTAEKLLTKVRSGDFAKHVDLGKVASAVAARSSSLR